MVLRTGANLAFTVAASNGLKPDSSNPLLSRKSAKIASFYSPIPSLVNVYELNRVPIALDTGGSARVKTVKVANTSSAIPPAFNTVDSFGLEPDAIDIFYHYIYTNVRPTITAFTTVDNYNQEPNTVNNFTNKVVKVADAANRYSILTNNISYNDQLKFFELSYQLTYKVVKTSNTRINRTSFATVDNYNLTPLAIDPFVYKIPKTANTRWNRAVISKVDNFGLEPNAIDPLLSLKVAYRIPNASLIPESANLVIAIDNLIYRKAPYNFDTSPTEHPAYVYVDSYGLDPDAINTITLSRKVPYNLNSSPYSPPAYVTVDNYGLEPGVTLNFISKVPHQTTGGGFFTIVTVDNFNQEPIALDRNTRKTVKSRFDRSNIKWDSRPSYTFVWG